ncbi:YbaN family protein [Candidatus Zixiibacteriota bacterium]
MLKSGVRKGLLSVCGVIAVILATLGIVLPLLPTTPFLLLAAACFIRSSDRLYRWLTAHRWFGPYIQNYREHRALTLRTKVVTVALLWITLGYTVFGLLENLIMQIALLLIGIGVTVHVLRYNTMRRGTQWPEHDDNGPDLSEPS